MNDDVNKKELYVALTNYLETYFVNRDLDGVLTCVAPDMTGYGTALDEAVYDSEAFRHIYARDIEQAPLPVYYSTANTTVVPLSDEYGIVMCELNIRTTIEEQKIRLNNLRQTIVFSKVNDRWLVQHLHISFPAVEHGAEESYPNKELEEHNAVLHRLVDKKTAELMDAMTRIQELATTDKLTGIYNRAKIDELLDAELARFARTGRVFTVIMIDIDHFKGINDSHGHLGGDGILKVFASLLSSRIRRTDALGRWGGEEFLILCPETTLEQAQDLAEELRNIISGHVFDDAVHATASFGIASFQHGDTSDSIIRRADDALYTAKRRGRNRVETYKVKGSDV